MPIRTYYPLCAWRSHDGLSERQQCAEVQGENTISRQRNGPEFAALFSKHGVEVS